MPLERIVIKVGTSTLTGGSRRLSRPRMLELVQQAVRLCEAGHEIVLVSSGAVAAGREAMDFPDSGRAMPAKQMLAAVGQSRLMHIYSELFEIYAHVVGQVLLTREDFADRARFLNARDTLLTMIDHRIIPIINENDTIATHEIRVGDNDNLSALVATLVEADRLIILTDQAGLYTADPRANPDARLIAHVAKIDDSIFALAGGTDAAGVGTGGMVTKLQAAQLATRSGVTTVVASGREPNVLERLIAGESLGTTFAPAADPVESRKRWLLMDKSHGKVSVDAGAVDVLTLGGASLLPVGVTAVDGTFERGAALSVIAPDGHTIARGLTSYSSDEVRRLCGQRSARITEILGYSYGDAIIHRNNLVVLR